MRARIDSWRHRHAAFLLVLFLFVSFRLLAVLLFRPGGFIADASDYDFYAVWGELGAMGYRTFDNLWTAYPPLFPALMLPLFELSSRIPPWVEPRLAFHTLFGAFLLLFETGNLILIYRLASKLERSEPAAKGPTPLLAPQPGLTAALLYALLFTPVFTLIGWFEPMPLFFLLLGLDLLLTGGRWSWVGSAVAAALGFLVKLTPIVLVPLAIRWLGARLSVEAARREWFNPRSPGNLLRPALYALVFAGVIGVVGYPIVRANPALALSSFRIQSIRPPWQSVWALLDGYYGFGLVPLDMRNLVHYGSELWESRLPWGLITLGFLLLYLWLYTRRYDWSRARTAVSFTGVSVIWLFLYSKGWSPQFLIWVLTFIVLLSPTPSGLVVAVTLSVINVVEAYLFLILLPDAHWLMAGTVLLRTLLLLLLAVEWLGQIWPEPAAGRRMVRGAQRLAWAAAAAALVGALVAAPAAADNYREGRLAAHPCRAAVEALRAEAGGPTRTILTEEIDVWRDLYPWLRSGYTLRVLDAYSPLDRPAEEVIVGQLDALTQDGEFWWIDRDRESAAVEHFFDGSQIRILERQEWGRCRATRFVRIADGAELAEVDVAGGPIRLLAAELTPAQVGQPLDLVLYWQTEAPVDRSYTVFTQLLGADGALLAQQDNLPVQGLAPTDTWQPGHLIRDPYRLEVPDALRPGVYRLWVGLYDGQGRRPLTLSDGTEADHVELTVAIDE